MEQPNPEMEADECIGLLVDRLQLADKLTVPAGQVNACLLGYGWWLGTVRTAHAVRQLYRTGFGHEASPLIRTALLHAASLEWLALEPDAVLDAVQFEHAFRRHRLYQQARQRGWELAGLDPVSKPIDPQPVGVDLLRSPEKLCDHIGMLNSYVPFLIESSYVHPSGLSGDTYLHGDDGVISLRRDSGAPLVSLRATGAYAVVATAAFGRLSENNDLADFASAIGDRLGISQE